MHLINSIDELTFFSDQSDLISMCIIILTLLLPISYYVYYRNIQLKYENFMRIISLLFISYIAALLFGMIYHLSNGYSGTETDFARLISQVDFNGDCSDENDLTCCNYYDNCQMSEDGFDGLIDHDTIIIPIKKNGHCPHLSDIIYKRDQILGYEDCENTEFGCCKIHSTCDSYVRLEFPYYVYNHTLERGYPIGYMTSMEPKIDEEGSNCLGIRGVVEEYALLNVGEQNYLSVNITITFIGVTILCLFCMTVKYNRDKKYNHISDPGTPELNSEDLP